MLHHIELDDSVSLEDQFADDLDAPIILVNLFDVDPGDHDHFARAWQEDAEFFCAQPGCVTAQLHQGIQGSQKFMNYAVFEDAAAFAATTRQPEFGPLRGVYPDSAVAHPHLFRRLDVPGVCVGDVGHRAWQRRSEPTTGLRHEELDSTTSLEEQFADEVGDPVVLVDLFDVEPADREDFKLAWQQDAQHLTTQPGCISVQLHQGIANSRKFLTYAVFEDAAAVAATTRRPESGPLRLAYPDSAVAHPHLFRRVAIPGICVGEVRTALPAVREAVAA